MFFTGPNKSFSTRLSLAILSFTVVVFLATFSVFYHFSASYIENDARDDAQVTLETINLHISDVLHQVEAVPKNLSWLVSERDLPPDSCYAITRRVIARNPYICGSAIAFEPNYYKSEGYYFSPYSCRSADGDSILSMQLGNANYDYFNWSWYSEPKRLNAPLWSEPYYDEGGGEMLMCTYSYPFYNSAGKLIGIFTADIDLTWLTDLINGMKKNDQSYTFMIDGDGKYIVHYLKERILHQTIFGAGEEMTSNTQVADLGRRMIAGSQGMATLDNDGVESFVFYAPVRNTNWSLAIVLPKDEVFNELYHINKVVFFITVIGLLTLFVLCITIVNRLTKPLNKFAASARQIASGIFNAKLPVIHSKDEMWELANSFRHMQNELARYISNLKETTAAKEKIDSELRIAREIQMGMIPNTFPAHRSIDLFATLKPAKDVGGDLYDFLIEDDYLYFAIGDVAGKGVPASLWMAVTHYLFRASVTHIGAPGAMISFINDTMEENNDSNMFVTLFIGKLHLPTGTLTYCNAGHNPPVLVDPANAATYMEVVPNMPIGILNGFAYQEQSCVLPEKSTLLCYTDGVTEAENRQQELYGEQRLLKVATEAGKLHVQELILAVREDIDQHVQGNVPSDDITLLAVNFKRQDPDAQWPQTLTMTNQLEETQRMSEYVEHIGEQLELTPGTVMNLQLALEEAITNIILYAYKEQGKDISVTFTKTGNELEVVIEDGGVPFDPTAREDPDHLDAPAEERPIGGLGIFLVKKLMDEVSYRRENDKNVLIMKKKIY
ncbi:MAG: SpoIIE family protein phosphatase [Prevotellaceae bacterium]|jgi:sigma-B regulation protein RsbU (phosphoserine phosphatase)|nr:SpoIIE family protein phosphatase [Prevotellaceae bacterium]